LLLIGARNHETRQFSPRQFLAECCSRAVSATPFGLFECLEWALEHSFAYL